MVDWKQIDSVFLDMDGTLLDLNFDQHFWQVHLPCRYAEIKKINLTVSKQHLQSCYQAVVGTLDWYSVDYWSRELDVDIAALKHEVKHLIGIHPYVVEFLESVKNSGKRVVLVTNAHQKSLNLKMQQTQLNSYFDQIICSHTIGYPKEDLSFWNHLQSHEPFNAKHTLLIDDSLPVLRAAKKYGLTNLLAVYMPNTQHAAVDVADFNAIKSFSDILPR